MPRRSDALHLATLLLLAAIAQLALRAALGIHAPIGLDKDLWGFATMDVSVGLLPLMHPLYPQLCALLMRAADVGHLDAGMMVSCAAAILVPAAAYGLSRQLGATPRAAGVAGLVTLLFPGVLVFGALVSADALTALALIGVAAAAAAYARKPGILRLVVLALVLAVTSVLREHGTLCALLCGVVVVLAPERHHQRVLGLVAIALALVLAPVLVGAAPALPGSSPWSGRLLVPVMDILEEHDATLARFPVGGLDLGPFHTIAFALTRAPVAWAWVALAYLAFLAGDRGLRAALLVGVGPALAGLMVISQPRHVWVTLPVCFAAWLATQPAASWARRLGWVGTILLLLLSQTRWIPMVSEGKQRGTWKDSYSITTEIGRFIYESERQRRRGAAICALASPRDLWAGDSGAFIFCPLRQHEIGREPNAANLHCWFAGERSPGAGWRRVWHPDLDLPLYRYLWMGSEAPLPCADSAPLPSTPFRTVLAFPATMEPPCSADEAFVAAYYATEESLDERDRLANGVQLDSVGRAGPP